VLYESKTRGAENKSATRGSGGKLKTLLGGITGSQRFDPRGGKKKAARKSPAISSSST
jgi:hypothetical protein